MINCEFFSNLSAFLSKNSKEIIGIIGTLSGTVLGWILKIIEDNHGKTEVEISNINEIKSQKGEYSLEFDIFICNHSLKPKYIKEFNICFSNGFKSIKLPPDKSSDTICFCDENQMEIVHYIELKYNEPQHFRIVNIFNNNQIKDFSKVKKINLKYKNEKNKTKKVTINKHFSIDKIKLYDNGKGLPIPK